MKKKVLFIVLLFILVFRVNALSVNDIKATDWMGQLSDDIKITDITIPGAHDACTVHSSAVWPASLYTLCQSHHIGEQSWMSYSFFDDDEKVTDTGLLNLGVRYLDIRYGLIKDKLTAEEKEREEAKKGTALFASEHLKLVHNTMTCEYQTKENSFGVGSYEYLDNEKFMSWLKAFLDKHQDEVIILAITPDDGKDNASDIDGWMEKFFKDIAEHPTSKYPKVYVGTSVPTLGEARGSLVVLTDRSIDITAKKPNDNKTYYWAFKTAYSEGDKVNHTFARAYNDTSRKYAVYKDNKYDGLNYTNTDDKWEYVRNGLRDALTFSEKEKAMDKDAFMFNYTNANNITKADLIGTPKDYAEEINPQVSNYINKNGPKFYGILAMDFIDASLAKRILTSNFPIDELVVDNTISKDTGSVFGKGSTLIIVFAFLVLVVVLIVAIVNKKNKKEKEVSKKKKR